MKLIILILFLFCFTISKGQDQQNAIGPYAGSNGPEKQKKETPKVEKIVVPPDSIAIIALRDYQTFFTYLQENISKANYDKMTPENVLSQFAQWAIVEFNRKKKK